MQRTWSYLLRVRERRERARWLPSANLAVRREVFERVGGFDESLTTCEDADLSYRLARQGVLLDDPEVIVLGGGLSNYAGLYEAVPARWDRYIFSDTVETRLLPARYGDSSGVRGAAWL